MRLSPRVSYLLIAIGCTGLLGFGYYLQFVEELEPCPMCIFQRICYFAVAVVAAIGAIHGPATIANRVYGALVALISLVGAGIAARQTWLQHLPPELVPECGPGLEFMLEMYPLTETIQRALRGTGECAVVDWTFLSLSIAEWSIACFVALAVAAIITGYFPASLGSPGQDARSY